MLKCLKDAVTLSLIYYENHLFNKKLWGLKWFCKISFNNVLSDKKIFTYERILYTYTKWLTSNILSAFDWTETKIIYSIKSLFFFYKQLYTFSLYLELQSTWTACNLTYVYKVFYVYK